MQICDSSSDEDETNKQKLKEDSEKNGHNAVDVAMKENKTPPTDAQNSKPEPMDEDVPKRRRYKKKQMVKRTYEDDEGFIRE